MATINIRGKDYDLQGTNWMAEMETAVKNEDYELAALLEQGRNQKIQSPEYGGKQATTNLYSQYLKTDTSANDDPWVKYAGTDFHQAAIDAAKAGDWEGVYTNLGYRDEKTQAQGDNRGKTSEQILAELIAEYGGPKKQIESFSYDVAAPTYSDNGLSQRIDTMLNEILNREAFSYNAAEDPLYKQYATMYQREGNRAMNDTLASAAAQAGGMNSYAMTAANQANNYYASQLNDKIPELYQLAYEMYLQDIDNQVRDLGLLQDMDNTQYNRYRDTMSDWKDDRNFALDVYKTDVSNNKWQQEFDHMVDQDSIANSQYADKESYNKAMDMLELGVMPDADLLEQAGISAEQAQQYIDNGYTSNMTSTEQKDAYNRAMDLLAAGAMPDAEMLQKAGMTEEQASAILAAVKAEQEAVLGKYLGTTGSTSSGSNTTGNKTAGGYDNGSLTIAQVKELQDHFGATPDGLWGSKSMDAAHGMTADEAWEVYQSEIDAVGNDPVVGTTGSGGYPGNDGLAEAQIKAMQNELGVTVDGKWGPKSQEAAKAKGWGTSATEAWDAYSKGITADGEFGYLNNGSFANGEYTDTPDAELGNAILDLDIGMVSEDTVWQMMQFGGVVEKDGKFVWANGWNKNNWKEKMAAATKNGGIGLYAGVSAGH